MSKHWLWALVAIGCGGSKTESPSTPVDAGADTFTPVVDAGPETVAVSTDGLYKLDGLERTLPRKDLEPIGRLARDATVVALGESVHTSGGFFQLKARVLEYLVEDLGYRVIAFESPWSNADLANEYVKTCTGTADDATKRLQPVWWDVTVSELLGWMCTFNKTHASDPVRLAGFDIAQSWDDARALRVYLDKVASADAARISDGLTKCFGVGFADHVAFFNDPEVQNIYTKASQIEDAPYAACTSGLDAANALLVEKKAAFIAASSNEQFELARLRIVGIRAFEDVGYYFLSGRDEKRGYGARDAGMYEVFKTLRAVRYPTAKIGMFEHNHHLYRKVPALEKTPWSAQTIGTLLDVELGAKYVPIGITGNRVGINWSTGPAFQVFNSPTSIEKKLHDAGAVFAFLDLVTTAEAPFAGDATYDIGFDRGKPAVHLAGLLYVDKPEGAKYVGGKSPFLP